MAILNDTYSEVKEEVENRREDFQVNNNLDLEPILYHNHNVQDFYFRCWIS